MRTASKYRLMVAFSVVCLLGLTAQSVYVWQLQDRLAEAGLSDDPVSSIEAKILDNLDPVDPMPGIADPFGWPSTLPMDPFTSMQQMQQQLDSFFGSMRAGSAFPSAGFGQLRSSLAAPAIEVEETPNEYRVTITVAPETEIELNTSLEGNALTIEGIVKRESADQRSNFRASMISQSQFSRTIELPKAVDPLGMSTGKTDAGIVILIPRKTG